jgi:hypothetical protein
MKEAAKAIASTARAGMGPGMEGGGREADVPLSAEAKTRLKRLNRMGGPSAES